MDTTGNTACIVDEVFTARLPSNKILIFEFYIVLREICLQARCLVTSYSDSFTIVVCISCCEEVYEVVA
jgi:hypothetical protein